MDSEIPTVDVDSFFGLFIDAVEEVTVHDTNCDTPTSTLSNEPGENALISFLNNSNLLNTKLYKFFERYNMPLSDSSNTLASMTSSGSLSGSLSSGNLSKYQSEVSDETPTGKVFLAFETATLSNLYSSANHLEYLDTTNDTNMSPAVQSTPKAPLPLATDHLTIVTRIYRAFEDFIKNPAIAGKTEDM